jgi:hypothetical protein
MPFKKGNKHGKGGARPNSGPTPLKIRELCRKSFAERLPILDQIADGEDEEARDRIAALGLLAKVGIPAQNEQVGDLPVFQGAVVVVPGLPK